MLSSSSRRKGRFSHVERIAKHVNIDKSYIETQLRGANRRFFEEIHPLIADFGCEAWPQVFAALAQARNSRRQKKPSGPEWMPKDCKVARRLLLEVQWLNSSCFQLLSHLQTLFPKKVKFCLPEINNIQNNFEETLHYEGAVIFFFFKEFNTVILAAMEQDRKRIHAFSTATLNKQAVREKFQSIYGAAFPIGREPSMTFHLTTLAGNNDNGHGSDNSSGFSDDAALAICAFCIAMGIDLPVPISTHDSWNRLTSALLPTLKQKHGHMHGSFARDPPALDELQLGLLLRSVQDLGAGRLSIIDPIGPPCLAVRPEGMGKMIVPLRHGKQWAIATIREDHSSATIYTPMAQDKKCMSQSFDGVYTQFFGNFTRRPRKRFHRALVENRHLCYLLVAFSAAMSVNIQMPVDHEHWQQLFQHMARTRPPSPLAIWVGLPAIDEIKDAEYIGVPLSYSDLKLYEKKAFRSFSRDATIHALSTILGPSFIQHLDNDNFVIHQSVLMMLFAVQYSSVPVEFCSWPSVANDLVTTIAEAHPSELTIFIADSGFNADFPLDDLFEALRFFNGTEIKVRMYPSQTELAWSRHKLGDLRLFDSIAKDMQCWRPQTCLGGGRCDLPATFPQVVKRNYSCAAEHVEIVAQAQRRNLRCVLPSEEKQRPALSRRSRDRSGYTYFHQELVPTLQHFGEFRVFVAAGKVTSILRTRFDWDTPTKIISAWKVQPEDFEWFSRDEVAQRAKLKQLEDFVLRQDARIRQYSEPGLNTVHIGARYDCGITEESSSGEFFISELTRLLSADTFPRCCPPPYSEILEPWAEAIAISILSPNLE